MTQPAAPRRRFAPVPIETTFKEHRLGGTPVGEPTPEPSPTSEDPPPYSPPYNYHDLKSVSQQTQTAPPREKRRFAPQLIESTRRSRRAGDVEPATRPVDKTDITPYHRHIYSISSKKKHPRRPGHARRESCDDEIAEHVFDLNKLDAQKKLEEVALSAFPNSGIRLGGAEHFFVRESSEDDDEKRGRSKTRGAERNKPTKRDSSDEDVNWMYKEMQKHAHQLQRDRGDESTDSGSAMSEGPPDNTFAFTNRARHATRGSVGPLSPIGEHPMPYIPAEPVHLTVRKADPGGSTFSNASSYDSRQSSRPIGEMHMPYIPSASAGKSADLDMPDAPPPPPPPRSIAPSPQIPPETGFANRPRGAFGRFYGYQGQLGAAQDKTAEKELFRLRTRQSPPMAGKDLVFRRCPSPKQTKLEPDQKWDHDTGTHVEPNRDTTGQNGLWRGYCFTANKGAEALVPSPRPAMIMTPFPPATPYERSDPFAETHGTLAPFPSLTADPTPAPSGASSVCYPNSGGSNSTNNNNNSSLLSPNSIAEHRSRAGQPKGLHMLMGLEQRLQTEKSRVDREERIAAEFTDAFVTQVYNYLSLGYPAMARPYDEELSKISRIPIGELENEDEAVMGEIGGGNGRKGKISMDLDMAEDQRTPRWKALKKYIFEWARQHPDLDGISPLAWGVQERRGSWGI